jgi:hypothetical protein
MQLRTTRTIATTLTIASIPLLSALTIAPQAGASTLYACVKKKTGTARFVSARTRCRKGETKLAWNTTGPAGSNGANGRNGANGKNGANGSNGSNGSNGKDGASAGYIAIKDHEFEIPPLGGTIATLSNLPAGSYILIAKVEVETQNPTEPTTVDCSLSGLSSDKSAASLDDSHGDILNATISLATALVLPIPFGVSLYCEPAEKGIFASYVSIAAIQVQSLTASAG